MSDTDHAPLPPSSAHMWVVCHGWRRMNGAGSLLDEDQTAAEEGTAAHWIAQRELAGLPTALGATAPNGVAITEEMADGAILYADAIGPERASLRVESRVTIPYVHPDNWGTPDAWRLHGNVIDVWDYKFGHRYVDAFENWQMLDYTAGIIGALQLPPEANTMPVRLTIVQPRCYVAATVRMWTITVADVVRYADTLHAAAAANSDPASQCTTGPHCRDCKARHVCQAHLYSGGACVELSGESVPVNITPAALGRQLALVRSAMDRLKSIESGLTTHGLALARDGARVPGFALKQGLGRQRWARPVDEVVALGAMMGVDVAKPGAMTPAQSIKAGLPAELVQAYSETPLGAVTLEADGSRFERIFTGGAV